MKTSLIKRPHLLATFAAGLALGGVTHATAAHVEPAADGDVIALAAQGDDDQDPSAYKYVIDFDCNPDTNSTTVNVYDDGHNLLGSFVLSKRCINAQVTI